MTVTPTLVLLGGAGLPAWIWDDLRALLADRGLDAVTPERPRTAGTSLADQADAVVAAAGPGPLALVAHSSGGVVAAEIVARHPQRVVAVLGLSAVVPDAGRSFVATLPLPARLMLGLLVRIGRTRPPAAAIRAGLGAGLSTDVVERLVADLDPEPGGHFADATSPRTWPAARGYVLTTDDRELGPDLQRSSAVRLGVPDDAVTELPTGHLPMLADPAGVAAAVVRLLDLTGTATRCPGSR